MDKISILNDLVKAKPTDQPFTYHQNNGHLRVLGRTEENGAAKFFDRIYLHTKSGYTLESEETLFHPTSTLDAILEALGLHNYLYFGSWRAKVSETREFFDRIEELKKQGAKEVK